MLPTLAEVSGIGAAAVAAPARVPNSAPALAGTSLAAVLADPAGSRGKPAALTQFPRCYAPSNLVDKPWLGAIAMACKGYSLQWAPREGEGDKELLRAMGYSLRTAGWRYTVWVPFGCDTPGTWSTCGPKWPPRVQRGAALQPRTGKDAFATTDGKVVPIDEELYEHRLEWAGDEFDAWESENIAGDPDTVALRECLYAQIRALVDRGEDSRAAGGGGECELVRPGDRRGASAWQAEVLGLADAEDW